MARTDPAERVLLQREVTRLELEQARDRHCLGNYQMKQLPDHVAFVKQLRRDIQYRQDRISNLKARLHALE